MNLDGTISYREFLLKELALRTQRNQGYSLRAFARDIQVPVPALSRALRGLKGFSKGRAELVAARLNLSSSERDFFVDLVESEHARSQVARSEARTRVKQKLSATGYTELDLEKFKIISDWFHFAILELTEVRGFQSDPVWISERLGIPLEQTTIAIGRLLEFGLLARSSHGKLKQTVADLAVTGEIPSQSVRAQHAQLLGKANLALEKNRLTERDFSAITLALNTKDIPTAKRMIQTFRRKFTKEMQESASKDRVYCISIQFFPLDQHVKEGLL